MASEKKVPYMAGYGTINKTLERIKRASTPDQFTQDFLANKLGQKGGSPKPVIPFLKRTGFLRSDGTPTELYKRFRNEAQSGAAAAEALRLGYAPLYDIDESIHDAADGAIKGVIVQATGLDGDSRTVGAILGSFKAIRSYADFDAVAGDATEDEERSDGDGGGDGSVPRGLNLSYTINLHLPATSEVAVFNAIFKSLKEHLLR